MAAFSFFAPAPLIDLAFAPSTIRQDWHVCGEGVNARARRAYVAIDDRHHHTSSCFSIVNNKQVRQEITSSEEAGRMPSSLLLALFLCTFPGILSGIE